VVRRPGSALGLAFVGGIDLCHGRRDDARYEGGPQGRFPKAAPLSGLISGQFPASDRRLWTDAACKAAYRAA
jgi:hypothetical protein